jgi:hypothetical protein
VCHKASVAVEFSCAGSNCSSMSVPSKYKELRTSKTQYPKLEIRPRSTDLPIVSCASWTVDLLRFVYRSNWTVHAACQWQGLISKADMKASSLPQLFDHIPACLYHLARNIKERAGSSCWPLTLELRSVEFHTGQNRAYGLLIDGR